MLSLTCSVLALCQTRMPSCECVSVRALVLIQWFAWNAMCECVVRLNAVIDIIFSLACIQSGQYWNTLNPVNSLATNDVIGQPFTNRCTEFPSIHKQFQVFDFLSPVHLHVHFTFHWDSRHIFGWHPPSGQSATTKADLMCEMIHRRNITLFPIGMSHSFFTLDFHRNGYSSMLPISIRHWTVLALLKDEAKKTPWNWNSFDLNKFSVIFMKEFLSVKVDHLRVNWFIRMIEL